MTRIIGGVARGRTLAVPESGTRPTSDRVREALFSALDARLTSWGDTRVLDLYAGSGALGLEAASRGAAVVTLVEQSARAVSVIERNITAVGCPGVEVARSDALRFAQTPPRAGRGPADLVLMDPPYDLPCTEVSGVIEALDASKWLEDGAVVVVERSARALRADPLVWPTGIEDVSQRIYGDTALCLGRRAGC